MNQMLVDQLEYCEFKCYCRTIEVLSWVVKYLYVGTWCEVVSWAVVLTGNETKAILLLNHSKKDSSLSDHGLQFKEHKYILWFGSIG